MIADSVGPWGFGVAVIVLAVFVFWIARKDKVSSLRFGVFLEHRREREVRPSEAETKIQGPWPGERGEK